MLAKMSPILLSELRKSADQHRGVIRIRALSLTAQVHKLS